MTNQNVLSNLIAISNQGYINASDSLFISSAFNLATYYKFKSKKYNEVIENILTVITKRLWSLPIKE